MSVGYPIGTRLIVCGRTLEVVENSRRYGCPECALRRLDESEVALNKGAELKVDNSLCASICQSLQCLAQYRADDKGVHWKLVEGST